MSIKCLSQGQIWHFIKRLGYLKRSTKEFQLAVYSEFVFKRIGSFRTKHDVLNGTAIMMLQRVNIYVPNQGGSKIEFFKGIISFQFHFKQCKYYLFGDFTCHMEAATIGKSAKVSKDILKCMELIYVWQKKWKYKWIYVV